MQERTQLKSQQILGYLNLNISIVNENRNIYLINKKKRQDKTRKKDKTQRHTDTILWKQHVIQTSHTQSTYCKKKTWVFYLHSI